jgi:hypothetical protein
MVPPIPQDDFGCFDFSSELLREFDFGAEFNFGREFSFVGEGTSTGSWSLVLSSMAASPFITPMMRQINIGAVAVAVIGDSPIACIASRVSRPPAGTANFCSWVL